MSFFNIVSSGSSSSSFSTHSSTSSTSSSSSSSTSITSSSSNSSTVQKTYDLSIACLYNAIARDQLSTVQNNPRELKTLEKRIKSHTEMLSKATSITYPNIEAHYKNKNAFNQELQKYLANLNNLEQQAANLKDWLQKPHLENNEQDERELNKKIHTLNSVLENYTATYNKIKPVYQSAKAAFNRYRTEVNKLPTNYLTSDTAISDDEDEKEKN